MRTLALALLISAAHMAAASPGADFVRAYSGHDQLERAVQAYEICQQLLSSPRAEYTTQIHELGSLWTGEPEGAYFLLSTCQTLWTTRYLDPVRSAKTLRQVTGAEAAYKIAALDLIGAARALRELIRLYNEIQPVVTGTAPPAPYEILIGMASTAEELDLALNHQEREATAALVAAGGGAAAFALRATTTAMRAGGAAAAVASFKAALAISLLAYGAGEAADTGLWWWEQRQAWNRVSAIMHQLIRRKPYQPTPVLLEEFYKAVERLGYGYSYDLYLVESGKPQSAAPGQCYDQLQDFFASTRSWARAFANQSICGDAAAVWAGASQFLTQQLPRDPAAAVMAERLMARAKRTMWMYAETARFRDSAGYVRSWPF